MFGTYKEDSIKQTTREKRQWGKDTIQYQVKNETGTKHIPLSRFLSHNQTKTNFTVYLAAKTLEYNMNSITPVAECTRSNTDMHFDDSNHEEADIFMIHQGVPTAQRSTRNDKLTFFSPDTDLLMFSIANYDMLPKDTPIPLVTFAVRVNIDFI